MKTHKWIRPLIVAVGLVGVSRAQGQATVLGNAGGTGDFAGWSGATTIPLDIRHNGPQPIDFYTDSIQRMRLTPNVNTAMGPLNQYTTVRRNGYLLLSGEPNAFTNPGCRAPFTRLHLIDSTGSTSPTVYAQQDGFRPWQRNGVTFTGNSDQCYAGAKYGANDNSDMVLQWSDNPEDAIYGTDRLRFLFTNRANGTSAYGARSDEGLESFRVYVPNDTTANVGIGDFYRATVNNGGVAVDPDEQLDVLDRTVRIRRLVPDYRNDTLSRVMVADGNGRVHWRNISTWPQNPGTGTSCDWEPNPSQNKIYTAWRGVNSNGSCPEIDWKVGIGLNNPAYKLDVYANVANGSYTGGQRVSFVGPNTGWAYGSDSFVTPGTSSSLSQARGVFGSVTGVDSIGYGVYGYGQPTPLDGHTKEVFGTHGVVYGPSNSSVLKTAVGSRGEVIGTSAGTITSAYGTYGKSSVANITNSYGVYGEGRNGATTTYGGSFWGNGPTGSSTYGAYCRATGGTSNYSLRATSPGGGANDWSGYFDGKVQIMGNLWNGGTMILSDGALKTDVQELGDLSERLTDLRPRRYRYTPEAQQRMGLSDNEQVGFIAQEVEEVLPQLVSSTVVASVVDTAGIEIWPAMDVSAVNYVGMIPLLVAGYQQQQTTIEEMRSQMQQMQQLLAACCNNPDAGRALDTGSGTGTDELLNGPYADRKLRIVPNPFSEPPTVYYTLDRGGRMQLIANSADGKQLDVLQEATLQAGNYQYEWDTTNLAPGMYYVTLLLDGQPMVKKAVKVTR
ncbi:MAG TPA: tail fiber domain-containing protein [Flavobacteriales bacterium]|nr:tail fiber domain-containing protein [Flavobacteriales bacterium]